MNNEKIFLYMISAAALCFCLFNILQFLLNYNKTAQTVGTIISIKTPGPETSKFRNSKWVVVSYKVKGRIYQSHNRIQVPMSSQIGSTVTVRYDKFTPEKLYSYSLFRIVVSFIIAAVFFVIARFEILFLLWRNHSAYIKIARFNISYSFGSFFWASMLIISGL